MKNRLKNLLIPCSMLSFMFIVTSCHRNGSDSDAFGNFEAEEVIVSAQSMGEVVSLNIAEGSEILKGQFIGRIDSAVPYLKKSQMSAQHEVIVARLKNLAAQLKVQEEQRNNLVREVERMGKLLNDHAATQQQYDDIAGKLRVLDSQTNALKSQKDIIAGEESVLRAQLAEADNLIDKCRIISPISGTVLEKYIDTGETATVGKALFKVANIKEMELKVYVSGSQLSSVALGDTVSVLIDGKDETMETLSGIVSWISSKVEFTPKIIQTREERVNMVYAVKIKVRNDGRLKIGMPGEVIF